MFARHVPQRMLGQTATFPVASAAEATSAARVAAPDVASGSRLRGLVQAHYASLWRVLRRLGVREAEIDDALQQVFLVASAELSALAPESERRFLYAVAVRVAANARRRDQRQKRIFSDTPAEDADARVSPACPVEQRELRDLLDRALVALPEDLRTVLVLFELEELSTQEIAECLALPAGTVASRLRRARERFAAVAHRLRVSAVTRGGAP